MKRKIIKSILLIAWMMIIYSLSNQPHSGAITHNVIAELLPFVKNNQLLDIINFIVRKSAHFTEYFILALLAISLLKEYPLETRKIIIISLIFCFMYAMTDEYHQTFVIDRTGQFKDVLIDTSGSILFLIIYYLKTKRKKL